MGSTIQCWQVPTLIGHDSLANREGKSPCHRLNHQSCLAIAPQ